MIKRVFVSLLILSSLATEGFTGLPGFFHGYLYAVDSSSYSELNSSETPQQKLPTAKGSKLAESEPGLSVNIACKTLNNLYFNSFIEAEQNTENRSYPVVSSVSSVTPVFVHDKDVKIIESDISPPNNVI
ncbi:MAG: hypothetical protein Q8920_14955 [Bacillota bacterium]|nr:hypothetical protein [Bacillota bacterium]